MPHITTARCAVFAIVTLALCGAAAASDDPSGPGAQTGPSVDGVLRLGSIMPLTGGLDDFGPGMSAAVELAVADINAAGGVFGRSVELLAVDSGTDPAVARAAAERLVATDRVDAIMGAAASGVTMAGVLPVTVPAGRVVCSGSATSPALAAFDDGGLFFRTAPSDAFQSVPLVDWIAADGHRRVAVINRADDYGQAFADLALGTLAKKGIEVVARVAVEPHANDFDAGVASVASASPDAVLLILFPEDGALILKSMIAHGIGPKDLAVYATDGLASDDLGAAVAPDAPAVVDGIKGTRPGAAEEPTRFNARLVAEKGVADVTFAGQFYDCTVAAALAALAAGSDDPAALATMLAEVSTGGTKCADFAACAKLIAAGEDVDFDGVTGFDLDQNGETAAGVYELWQFSGGAIAPIKTVVVGAAD